MNILKSFVNAFSAYSFMPLPYYEDEGDRYRLAFVPIVGALIYFATYCWYLLGWYRCYEDGVVALGIALIAIVISGGRHVLGFIAYIDSFPTFKYRFPSWSQSRDRGVLRFMLTMTICVICMVNIYDYMIPIVLFGFIASRIAMGLLSTIFNEFSNQSKNVIVVLLFELLFLLFYMRDTYEHLVIGPLVAIIVATLCFINRFRRCTKENLSLLEDDFIITAETAWIFSVAIVSLVRSL